MGFFDGIADTILTKTPIVSIASFALGIFPSPAIKKIQQVISNVAITIPDKGQAEAPIVPTILAATVTKKKLNIKINKPVRSIFFT